MSHPVPYTEPGTDAIKRQLSSVVSTLAWLFVNVLGRTKAIQQHPHQATLLTGTSTVRGMQGTAPPYWPKGDFVNQATENAKKMENGAKATKPKMGETQKP
jgi:hypothetical protein